jgi:hypothetical protein
MFTKKRFCLFFLLMLGAVGSSYGAFLKSKGRFAHVAKRDQVKFLKAGERATNFDVVEMDKPAGESLSNVWCLLVHRVGDSEKYLAYGKPRGFFLTRNKALKQAQWHFEFSDTGKKILTNAADSKITLKRKDFLKKRVKTSHKKRRHK